LKKPRPRYRVPAGRAIAEQPTVTTEERTVASWSGPLPPPAFLADFDRIVHNGAERVFAQFEAEATHRRAVESRQSFIHGLTSVLGQVLAGLFAAGALSLIALAIEKNQPWIAAVLGAGTVSTCIIAFIKGRQNH
jgi:uncharacterized membrane protein